MYTFVSTVPEEKKQYPIVISGLESLNLKKREYLISDDLEFGGEEVFEIRYEHSANALKDARIVHHLLAVGHGEYFYLFNMVDKVNILCLKMRGYFGHLYVEEGLLYVTDADGVYCIDQQASLVWHQTNLGIDGVILSHFTRYSIHGSGEWDPPNGWKDFVLHKNTGEKINVAL